VVVAIGEYEKKQSQDWDIAADITVVKRVVLGVMVARGLVVTGTAEVW
jgi:hypothetical protein